MGLDMYLYARSKKTKEDVEVAYWRKANQVLKFFKECFGEMENCKEYNVSIDTIKGLLPVLDDCERALQMLENSSDESAKQGTALIYDKLMAYLKSCGLEVIKAKGEVFDVDYHEAVTQFPAPSEEMKGKVIDVVQTGYMLGGKVIRYAKVVVGA